MIAVRSSPSIQVSLYAVHKSDGSPREYEDAAAYRLDVEGTLHLAVADGATEAYDARRWVDLLTTDFIESPIPPTPAAVVAWVDGVQATWARSPRAEFTSFWDQERATTPAFGTFLGVEIDEVGWRAVAVGDTVLFHLRSGRRIATFPPLGAADFGFSPRLVTSRTSDLDALANSVEVSSGLVRSGDHIVVATDALAHWAIARDEAGCPPWNVLARIGPDRFDDLVGALRASGELHDDDVTMAVVRIGNAPAR